jgi:hypothetical protein
MKAFAFANRAAFLFVAPIVLIGVYVGQFRPKIHPALTLRQHLAQIATQRDAVLVDIEGHESEIRTQTASSDIQAISTDYGLSYISRPGVLVLSDGKRSPSVGELKELAAYPLLLLDFVQFDPIGIRRIQRKRDFYSGLSREQLAAMKSQYLPFNSLRPEQQSEWANISRSNAYGRVGLEFRNAYQVLENWGDVEIVGATRDDQKLSIRLRCSSSKDAEFTRIDERAIPEPSKQEKDSRFYRSAPSDAIEDLPLALAKPFPVTNAWLSYRQIVDIVAECARVTIQCRDSEKAIWLITNSRASCRSVIVGLMDLGGLRWKTLGNNRFELTLGDTADLSGDTSVFDAVAHAIPLALKSAWIRDLDPLNRSSDRHRIDRVIEELEKRKQSGMVLAASLSKASQTDLARLVFDHYVRDVSVRRFLQLGRPPLWLTSPETGHFALIEDSKHEDHPTLLFRVPRSDGQSEFWGWRVGTGGIVKH